MHDDRLLVAAASTIEQSSPSEIELWQVEGTGPASTRVATVTAATPFAGTIALVCTTSGVWLVEQNPIDAYASNTSTTLRTVDVEQGTVAPPSMVSNLLKVLPAGASVGDDLVLSGLGDLSSNDGGERYPRRWANGVLGPPAETRDAYFASDSYLLSIAGHLLDVRPLLANPPGENASPAIGVAVPPVG